VRGRRAAAVSARAVREAFHRLYYYSGVWEQTFWLGVATQKCPLDLWIYQEILSEQRPDLIVETGTCRGGSALFLASICDLLRHGRVLTIDVERRADRPRHRRIRYLGGSSTDPAVVARVRAAARKAKRVLVILDSDHRKAHVLDELRAYAPLVSVGSYVIVEDTNINGHPVLPQFGPGPMEAARAFLARDRRFVVDRRREKLLLSFFPRGWLRRVRR
jgi:cephalosporin hydroxylase